MTEKGECGDSMGHQLSALKMGQIEREQIDALNHHVGPYPSLICG